MKLNIRKHIRNWLFDEKEEACPPGMVMANYSNSKRRSISTLIEESAQSSELHGRGSNTTFKVHPAVGGAIVEVNRYDDKRDNNVQTLHLVSEDGDYAQEIGRIVAMEMLKY